MYKLFAEFNLIGSNQKILINCEQIVTIVYSGEDRTELRLANGGVHIVKGGYETIRDSFLELN